LSKTNEIKDYPVIELNVNDIKKDPTNPNTMTLEQERGLEKSIVKFGRLKHIVVDQDNVLIDGEHRLEVEKANGTEKVNVIQVNVKDEIERKMMRETLNKLHGTYNKEKESSELLAIFENQRLDELAELLAQPKKELEDLISQYNPDIKFQKDEDEAQLPSLFDIEPFVKQGEIWQLGQHRIMCADARNDYNRNLLFNSNKHPQIILTDPPYSSGGFQETGKRGGSIGNRQNITIQRDNLSTRGFIQLMEEVFHNLPCDIMYLFTDWKMWIWNFDVAERLGYVVRNMLVWDKLQMGMGLPWRNQHELILFAKKTPSKMLDGKTGNVLKCKRQTDDKLHPTIKPVELLKQILDNTEGNIVYDPFLGSGSTLIACEQTNRICYGMEIDEHYCSVIIKRWELYTNQKAKKV
jgi:DNA modification methylase